MAPYRIVKGLHGNSSREHLAELRGAPGPAGGVELVTLCGRPLGFLDTGRTANRTKWGVDWPGPLAGVACRACYRLAMRRARA